jgi:hypothetical protein
MVAALCNVVRNTWEYSSGMSRHGRTVVGIPPRDRPSCYAIVGKMKESK